MKRFIENVALISILTIYYCIAQICKEQEIYDFFSSSCLKCSSECQSCFNIGSSQCISCSQNSYQSYDDISTCQNQCQKNEFVDSVSQRCIRCKVAGCVKCNSEQICEECDENLELIQEYNQCNAKRDNCQFSLQFMMSPFSENKCLDSCPQSYYQNYSNQICEQTQKCPQIQQISSSVINGNINSISYYKENQYIVMIGGSCSYALVDENWNIITKQTIQEKKIFGKFARESNFEDSLVSGKYGLCLQGKRLNVINFETLQIEFDDPNLAYNYMIRYVDDTNQLVFMTYTNLQAIVWYDFKNKKISEIQLDFYVDNFDKFIKSYYLYERETDKLLIANFFKEDSSLKTQIPNQQFLFFPKKLLLQKNNCVLFYYGYVDLHYIYRIIFDEEGQILEQVIIYQFTMELIEQFVFSSKTLNLVLLYSKNNNEMAFLQFNEQFDQILINETIITGEYNNIIISDNLILNSFYIFIQERELYRFGNITDTLVQYHKTKQLTIKFSSINQIFLDYDVRGFWILKDEIQIIFSKYQRNSELFGLFNTCIRYRYNFGKETAQFQYLNPYQFLFISESLFDLTISDQKYISILPQNKLVITESQKPTFYTVNNSNLLQNVLVSKQDIVKQITYLQKNPRIFTTVSQDLPIKNYNMMSSRIIENQILVTSVPLEDGFLIEYVTDIKNEKIILNYTLFTYLLKSKLFYIKSKNFLVIEDNMIVYDLNNSKIFANLADIYGNAVNIEDRILLILNIEGKSLHQLDLETADIVKIFDFTEDFHNFMLVDQTRKLPAIFDGDIIYLQDSTFYFQPFSISQKKLLYSLVNLGIDFNSQFITLNIKKEIFIISFSQIKIFSFDLQDLGVVTSGYFFETFFYDHSFLYFCVFDFFFKFDLVNRKLINLEIINISNSLQPLELKINFYRLDESNYFKQSEIIIDSKNMIIVKSQQEKNLFIGQIQQGDQQLYFFQSQNEFYWHINLFNTPYRVQNLKTQNQIFLAQQFDQNQNMIVIYDNNDNQITIYNQTKLYKTAQIDFIIQSDLNTYVLDWITLELIYVTNNTLYLFSPFSAIKNQEISVLTSKIIQYKVCNKQSIIIALTSQNYIYSINMQDNSQIEINLNEMICTSVFEFNKFSFDLECDRNFIIFYQPCFQIYDFTTGLNDQIHKIQFFDGIEEIPIIYEDTCKFESNLQIYDIDDQISIFLKGEKKQILIVNYYTRDELFLYKTTNKFDNESSYYFQQKKNLLLVDNTPILYLFDSITHQVTLFQTYIYQTKGILMDELKNTIFMYSDQFIHIYQYPEMTFLETFTISEYDQTFIVHVYLNLQLNVLNVQTQSSLISYDLTEVLYTSEINLVQYQNIQNVVIDDEYQVYYSLANYSINLFHQEILVDYLLLVIEQYTVYPYFTEIIQINNNQLVFILFNDLYFIEVDLQKQKLILISTIKLSQYPQNFLYDNPRQQLFLLYQQDLNLNSVNLQEQQIKETNLITLPQTELSQAVIAGNYIILPSANIIYTYDILSQKLGQIDLQNTYPNQFLFKLQSKSISNYQNNWWKVPFEYEERQNTNDFSQTTLSTELICVMLFDSQNTIIQIIDIKDHLVYKQITLEKIQVTNIVNDPFRKLIYAVINQGTTHIYDWNLQFIAEIKNQCLKQAVITFDNNFIYSVCPMGIIIYNRLNFQQQFPAINSGLNESSNIISINYNNYFLIIEKEDILLIQLQYDSSFKILFKKKNKYYQAQVIKLIKTQDDQHSLLLILSSQSNIERFNVPLSPNDKCNLVIQQRDRIEENIHTQETLIQTLSNFQNFQVDTSLQVIEIIYLDQQCIRSLSQQLFNQIEASEQLSLVNSSKSINEKICWEETIEFTKQIINFQIKQMTLTTDSIDLNQSSFMKIFQMSDINLSIKNSLTLSNFEKVYLTNINLIFEENSEAGELIIQNCQLVVIEQLNIISIKNSQNSIVNLINNVYVEIRKVLINGINIEQELKLKINTQKIFNLNSNTNLIIDDITITTSSNLQIFYLNNAQSLAVTGVKINQSQHIQFLDFQLVQSTRIAGVEIIQLQSSSFFYGLFSANTTIQSFEIKDSSSLNLIILQNLQINTVSFMCKELYMKSINILTSNATYINLQVGYIEINNLNNTLMLINSNFIDIDTNKLLINQFYLDQITPIYDNNNFYALNLINISSFTIDDAQFYNNTVSFLKVSQQQQNKNEQLQQGQVNIFNCQLINNTISIEASLILLNNLNQIQLLFVLLQANTLNQNKQSSFIKINQGNSIAIEKCTFENNTNFLGYGGALYLTEITTVSIDHSKFISNKCLVKNGGAINYINTQFLGTLEISFSDFILNKAIQSTGGAINLSKINLILQHSNIDSNKAQIGGGIFYQEVVPDFILLQQKGNALGNTISNNQGQIYGRNVGSTLRKIFISNQDVLIENEFNITQNQNQLDLNGIQSGDQITFKKIQVLDEEGTPVYIPSIQDQANLSEDILVLIRQISIQITCDSLSSQINCVGNLKSSDFQEGGFSLTVQTMFKPVSSMLLKIQSNIIPQLVDSQNNIYTNEGQVSLDIQLNFDECKIGQIQKQFRNSIICETCPEGKYSLDIVDSECQKCPESAEFCSGSIIQLKDGYWRSNEFSDDIIYCSFNPSVCKPQSSASKVTRLNLNCDEGYVGIICGSCDTYGKVWGSSYAEYISQKSCYKCEDNQMLITINNLTKILLVMIYIFFMVKNLQKQLFIKILGHYVKKSGILFLSNTYKSDRAKIFSKILNDHLQILSLIYGLFNSFSSLSVPIQISGNQLGSISKSIDCLLAQYPEMHPIWFYQLLWSLLQPIIIIFFYFLIGYILLKLKQNLFIRHARAALIFIYFYYFVSIITTLSKTLNCVQIGKEKYMDLDFNIKCYDSKYHLPYIFIFCIPLLIIYGIFIPIILFVSVCLVRKGKKSFFVKVQYSYIFAGFRDKLYYWEFFKIIYKASIILIFVLLKENKLLQVQIMNIIMSLNFFLVGRLKPYIQQNYNDLQQSSTLLCILALNLFYIQQSQSQLELFLALIVILPNLYILSQLLFGMVIVRVKANKEDNNLIQNFLLKLKRKYPQKFTNVQVISNQKIRALIKLKDVQKKFRILLKFLKGYNIYNEDQLAIQFNLESQFMSIPSERKKIEKIRNSNLNFLLSSLKSEETSNNFNYFKQKSVQSQILRKNIQNEQQQTISNLDLMNLQNIALTQENQNMLLEEQNNFFELENDQNKNINH